MIKIGVPFIKTDGANSRLCSKVVINDVQYEMYFEVDKEYQKYLCVERADAFLVSLLPYAMNHGYNIISEGSISDRLYYQMTTVLIPCLSKYLSGMKTVNISTRLDDSCLNSMSAIGTGISAGVDSFHTLLTHHEIPAVQYNITHLTFFNVGSHGDSGGNKARVLFNQRTSHVKNIADETNMKFVAVDSNISEIIKMSFVRTHTFRSLSAVLALQKLFKVYYYASGFPLDMFGFREDSTAYYDLLNVHCLSTQDTAFYSTGAAESRLDKLRIISDYEVTYRYLNVCYKDGINCGLCEKCIRTMLGLYSLGKLELYNNVFDVEAFYNKLPLRLGFMLAKRRELNYKEILAKIKENNKPIPLKAHIYSVGYIIGLAVKSTLRKSTFAQSIYRSYKNKLKFDK